MFLNRTGLNVANGPVSSRSTSDIVDCITTVFGRFPLRHRPRPGVAGAGRIAPECGGSKGMGLLDKSLARYHDLTYAARLHTTCPLMRIDEALL